MALRTCPACARPVSTAADVCPACGHPLKRGLLGRAGPERAANVGCMIVLMLIGAFYLLRGC